MTFIETLTIGVGAAVAKTALTLWLKDSEVAAAAATSTVDALAKMLPFPVRGPTQREFQRIAEEVGRRLERFLEAECPGVPENEKMAASLAVAGAFDRAGISDDLLFAKNLDPRALELHVLRVVPDADRDLSGGLYPRILHESCNYVIEITSTLPGFGLRAIQETLRREGEIAELVKRVLEEMPPSKGTGAGDASDEAFESQYRQNVARELDQLRLFGITTERVSPRYGLSVAYITLSAARPTTRHLQGGLASRSQGTSSSDEEDEDEGPLSIPVDEALAGSERVLIRGEAGSGKTTLLQWLAVQSARDSFTGALAEWNGTVPFFIQLRRWVTKGLPQPEHWLTHVASSIAGAMPSGWVHRQLKSGALVLIDGVDELPDAQRELVREWLQGLTANAPASRFIVTSRPAAAEEGWLRAQGFDDSQLQPMEREQIEALIDQWHVAARKQITDEEIIANLDEYQESLKRVVHSDRSIRNLATTPLLCAMLCLLNVDRRTKIPKDRMALYRIALETLARRETERETDWANVWELTERQRELSLEELAYWLLRNNNRSDATRPEAEGVIADKLPQLAHQKARVVQYLLERSGLLREPVVDRIDFIHRTFQEYLAAKRLIAAHDIGVLLQHAHNPSWREVVILATGHASDSCEVILKGLLERADKEPWKRHYLSLLAVSCLETATAFSEGVRDRIRNRLAELVPPKSITEAKALSSAGDIALPYLAKHRKGRAQHVAACIRALSLIGGDAALNALKIYSADNRQTVKNELLRALDYFDRKEYTREILSGWEAISIARITDISFLEGLAALRSLSLWRCKGVRDLTPLAELTALESLEISGCEGVSDVTPLAELTALESLDLSGFEGVSDLTPLGGLTCLQSLKLRGYKGVSDLTPLGGLTALQSLSLWDCEGVSDLTPLAGLTCLQSLDLPGCEGVSDLSPLAELTALESLDLQGCKGVSDLTPLGGLTCLQSLDLWGCEGVSDLNPLAGLAALQSLRLYGCKGVRDLTPLAGLTLVWIHVSDQELIETAPPNLRGRIVR